MPSTYRIQPKSLILTEHDNARRLFNQAAEDKRPLHHYFADRAEQCSNSGDHADTHHLDNYFENLFDSAQAENEHQSGKQLLNILPSVAAIQPRFFSDVVSKLKELISAPHAFFSSGDHSDKAVSEKICELIDSDRLRDDDRNALLHNPLTDASILARLGQTGKSAHEYILIAAHQSVDDAALAFLAGKLPPEELFRHRASGHRTLTALARTTSRGEYENSPFIDELFSAMIGHKCRDDRSLALLPPLLADHDKLMRVANDRHAGISTAKAFRESHPEMKQQDTIIQRIARRAKDGVKFKFENIMADFESDSEDDELGFSLYD